jgi:hypothetical protein
MKTVLATVLTLGLVALVAGPAAAQGPRGFGARMGSYSGLLGNESVQKELKLDEKQVEKAKALEEKINGEMQEKFQGLQDLEPQERRTKMQEINREISASTLKAAGEFIKPEQIARLKQIAYQVRGAQNFSDPDVAKKLNLTDAQKTDIQTIQMEAGQERRAIFQEAQDDREAAMKKMAELNKKTLAKVEAKLNDEQQKTWKELLGAPFEIKYEQN